MLLACLTLGCAAAAGYAVGRFVEPFSTVGVALGALGGAAAALLAAVMPGQAWRVLRRGWIFARMARRRRAVRRTVRTVRARLTKAVEDAPAAFPLCDLAVAEYLRNEHETAASDLAHALELEPDHAALLNNLGVVFASQQQYDRAAELFVRSVNGSADAPPVINCALVAPHVRDPEELARMVAEGGHLTIPMALNNIGVAHAHAGRWELAAHRFRAAAEAAPDLPPARANMGLVAYHQGQLQDAANEIQQASKLDPNEPAFANHLGVILAAAGQIDQARTYLRRALRMDPASVAIRVNMAALDAHAGHWRLACRGFKALLSAGSYRPDAYYNLAVCDLAVQEPGAAAEAAAAAIAAGDESADAYTVLAVALWEVGRRAEALSHFQSAITARGAGPLTYSSLGRALLLQGDLAPARATLQEALRRWPDDPDLIFDQATATAAAGLADCDPDRPLSECAGIIAILERAYSGLQTGLNRADLAAEAHVNLGLCHYAQEQYEAAAEHFEAAGKQLQKNKEVAFLTGTALGKDGERQTHRTEDGDTAPTASGRGTLRRAVPYLETATGARDVFVEAHTNLGRCLYMLKEFDQALTAFRRAVRFESSQEINTMAALAAARSAQRVQLLLKTQLLSDGRREQLRGRVQELLNVSVHYFRQALLRNEMDPILHGNLGIAYMLRNGPNDVEAALRHWERMRAIGGGAMERRYAELAQMENLADPSRVGFDDRNLQLRDVVPLRWVAVPPPRPAGIRFLTEAVAVQRPWRIAAASDELRRALECRDAIAADELRLRRLRV